MSAREWFSCAPTAGDHSISRRHSALPFWVSARSLRLAFKFYDFVNGSFHALLRQCCPSHRTMGACNIHETIRWTSFISMFGRFGVTTGRSSRDHMPASCRLNISPTNHGRSPSTPPASRFRDTRVTCSGKQEASDSSPVFGCLSVCF
jgi:hypothetical protein